MSEERCKYCYCNPEWEGHDDDCIGMTTDVATLRDYILREIEKIKQQIAAEEEGEA